MMHFQKKKIKIESEIAKFCGRVQSGYFVEQSHITVNVKHIFYTFWITGAHVYNLMEYKYSGE